MKIAIRTLFWLVAGAVLLFAPAALADGVTVSMLLTSPGTNGAMAGVYVGPYVAMVNGVSTPIVCDDYVDESYLNESWTANVSTLADLSGTKWGSLCNATTLYEEAAWLTEQLVSAPPSQAGDIQFAIWALFDPSAVDGLSLTDQGIVQGWLTQVEGMSFSTSEFPNILIYTPNTNYSIECNGQPCANTPPQEFMVDTPEPGELGLLLIGLTAIAIGVFRKTATCRIA